MAGSTKTDPVNNWGLTFSGYSDPSAFEFDTVWTGMIAKGGHVNIPAGRVTKYEKVEFWFGLRWLVQHDHVHGKGCQLRFLQLRVHPIQ